MIRSWLAQEHDRHMGRRPWWLYGLAGLSLGQLMADGYQLLIAHTYSSNMPWLWQPSLLLADLLRAHRLPDALHSRTLPGLGIIIYFCLAMVLWSKATTEKVKSLEGRFWFYCPFFWQRILPTSFAFCMGLGVLAQVVKAQLPGWGWGFSRSWHHWFEDFGITLFASGLWFLVIHTLVYLLFLPRRWLWGAPFERAVQVQW